MMFHPYGASARVVDAKERYGAVITSAFRIGISIMEMTRVTGNKDPNFFYSVLRDAGAIPPMKRGRSRVYELPEYMVEVFKHKVSFAKWCHFWDFSPQTALVDLAKKIPDRNQDEYMYHWALRRDFPYWYEQHYPASPARNIRPLTMTRGLVRAVDKCEVRIAKSGEGKCFIASIVDEDVYGEGESWSEAVRELELLWRIERGIIRLNKAIGIFHQDE